LGNNEVHIWQASLSSFPTAFQQNQLFQYLTDEERLRADRYVHIADRVRFIVARGVLRVLLGGYLNINPANIVFEYGAHGKPRLASILGQGSSNLCFNISHAGDGVACIFARGREVGIDIEQIRDNVDIEGIAERFFSASEFLALQRIAPTKRLIAFFNTWSRKEAFIKAIGSGLFYSLQQFDVSIGLDEPAALLAIDGDQQKAKNWALHAFTPMADYVGAWIIGGLIEGQVDQIQYRVVEGDILCV
jgi:4'-phosphopantetheinyl transferase